jgi:hypothetical protein
VVVINVYSYILFAKIRRHLIGTFSKVVVGTGSLKRETAANHFVVKRCFISRIIKSLGRQLDFTAKHSHTAVSVR